MRDNEIVSPDDSPNENTVSGEVQGIIDTMDSDTVYYWDLPNGKRFTVTALLQALVETSEDDVLTPGEDRVTSYEFRKHVAEEAGYSTRTVAKVIDNYPDVILSRAARLQLDFSNGCHPIKIVDDGVLNDLPDVDVTDSKVVFKTTSREPEPRDGETKDDGVTTDVVDSVERLEDDWREKFPSFIPENLILPPGTVDFAEGIYISAHKEGIQKGLSSERVAHGSFAIAVKEHVLPVQFNELADFMDISTGELYKIQGKIVKCLGIELTPTPTEPFLKRYLGELDAPDAVERTAFDLLRDLEASSDAPIMNGSSPPKSAAIIIYAAAVVEEWDITQDTLVDLVGMSAYPIQKGYKDVIVNSADRLNVDPEAVMSASNRGEVERVIHGHADAMNRSEPTLNISVTGPADGSFSDLPIARQRCVDAFLTSLNDFDWDVIRDEEYVVGLTPEFRKSVGRLAGHSESTVTTTLRNHGGAVLERFVFRGLDYGEGNDVRDILPGVDRNTPLPEVSDDIDGDRVDFDGESLDDTEIGIAALPLTNDERDVEHEIVIPDETELGDDFVDDWSDEVAVQDPVDPASDDEYDDESDVIPEPDPDLFVTLDEPECKDGIDDSPGSKSVPDKSSVDSMNRPDSRDITIVVMFGVILIGIIVYLWKRARRSTPEPKN